MIILGVIFSLWVGGLLVAALIGADDALDPPFMRPKGIFDTRAKRIFPTYALAYVVVRWMARPVKKKEPKQ